MQVRGGRAASLPQWLSRCRPGGSGCSDWGLPAGLCAHGLEEQSGRGNQSSWGVGVIGASDRGQHAESEQLWHMQNMDGSQLWGSPELSSRKQAMQLQLWVRFEMGSCCWRRTSF